jgi:hypothetical protein
VSSKLVWATKQDPVSEKQKINKDIEPLEEPIVYEKLFQHCAFSAEQDEDFDLMKIIL